MKTFESSWRRFSCKGSYDSDSLSREILLLLDNFHYEKLTFDILESRNCTILKHHAATALDTANIDVFVFVLIAVDSVCLVCSHSNKMQSPIAFMRIIILDLVIVHYTQGSGSFGYRCDIKNHDERLFSRYGLWVLQICAKASKIPIKLLVLLIVMTVICNETANTFQLVLGR